MRTQPTGTSITDGDLETVLQQCEMLQALQAVRSGDFSVRLPGDRTGIDGKIADTFNDIIAALHERRLDARRALIGQEQADAHRAPLQQAARTH